MLFFLNRLKLKHLFSYFLDRPVYYKKRKFDDIDQLTQEDIDPGPSARRDIQHAPTPARVINLAPNEIVKRKSVAPLKIYAGNSIFIEIKEWKKKLCIGYSKEEEGADRNGSNIEMDHFEKS